MSMSKNYGSGCYGYSRRRCGRNNRCGCDDNGVSTGTLLAAGVAASLVALAFSDCTTTTTTTPSATISSEPIAAVVNYYLPGAAGGALATPTNISAASQPLGTIAPQTGTGVLAAVPASGTLASLGASGGVLANATSGMANTPVVALPIPTTTAAVISTYWQVNLSLAPFVTAATLAGYPTTTTGLTTFFTSGGLSATADVVTVEIRVGNVNNYFSTGELTDVFASATTTPDLLSSAQNARSLATTTLNFQGLTTVGVTGAPTTGGASFYNTAAPPAITAITMGTGIATLPTAGTTLDGKISVWATSAIAGVAATPTGAELAAAVPTFASYSGIAASGTPTTQQYYRTTFTFNDIINAAVAAAAAVGTTSGSVTKLFAFGMTPQRSNSIAALSTITQVGASALTLSYPFDSGVNPSTFIPSVFTTAAGFGDSTTVPLAGNYSVNAGTLVVAPSATPAATTLGRTNFQIGFSYQFKGMDGFFFGASPTVPTASPVFKVYYINGADTTIAARGGANAPASGVGALGSITTTGGGTTATVIVQVANQP